MVYDVHMTIFHFMFGGYFYPAVLAMLDAFSTVPR